MVARSFSFLPIQVATRLVFDSVSYSNPLPPWTETLTTDYTAKEETIVRLIGRYLDGEQPTAPFAIVVPNNAGTKKKTWIIPSVNDQIVLQTVASSLAEKVGKVIDSNRVFSYRRNTNPNRLQLTDSQVSLWGNFQSETHLRLRNRSYVLQLDLEEAFRSIDQVRFLEFFENLFPGTVEVMILKVLLRSFDKPEQGLPLINDSLFFLGNAYLSVIDNVLKKHTVDFIRFVDDYRVFGESRESLEDILSSVNRELQQMGFKINLSKLKLGSSEEYLEAVSKAKYATTKGLESSYISAAVVFDDVVNPELMVRLVARVVENPDRCMNEGYGRLILGAIRRMRLNDEMVQVKNYNLSPLLEEYSNLLSDNTEIVRKTVELLKKFAWRKDEAWRTVWLLFVMSDMRSRQVNKLVREIQNESSVPLIARLWASKLWPNRMTKAGKAIEEFHDANYLEAGKKLVGRNIK